MRLFHNILYRKFKSFPLSYYKRGPSLIEFANLTSSINSNLSVKNTSLIPTLGNISTSDLGFGYLDNSLFNADITEQNFDFQSLNYNEGILELSSNSEKITDVK